VEPSFADIKLTQGYVAVVDVKDLAAVSVHRWRVFKPKGSKTVYAQTDTYDQNGKRTTILLHQSLWKAWGKPDTPEIDHRDGDGLNNQEDNLRPTSGGLNQGNVPKRSHNTSGFKGVTFFSPRNLWRASISKDGKKRTLGYGRTPEEAARLYDAAAVAQFGEFAVLNFPLKEGDRAA
jgi:hypothetical protein